MALVELSGGLSNEACESRGNKLTCSVAATPMAPPAARLVCVPLRSRRRGGGASGGGGEEGRQNKCARLAGRRSSKKKKKWEWDESCDLL